MATKQWWRVGLVALLVGACGGAPEAEDEIDVVSSAACSGVKLANLTLGVLPSGSSAALVASNATCAAGQTAEYRFLYKYEGGPTTYTAFREWSTDPTASFDNTGLPSGKYTLLVRARNVGSGKIGDSSAMVSLSSGNVCGAVSLTATPKSPSSAGIPVLLTGAATCTEAGAEYQFLVRPPGSAAYTALTSFGSSTTSWGTSGLASGTYTLLVYARGTGNTTKYESSKTLKFSIADDCSDATASVSPPGPSAAGTLVTVFGGAACAAPELLYQFRRKGPNPWTQIQGWGTATSAPWDTTGIAAGTYQVRVSARAAGLMAAQSSRMVDYAVTAPIATCVDGSRNGTETGVDCGGGTCPACSDGSACAINVDCASLVCSAGVCLAPSCTDLTRNGGESDVDCGGVCPACSDGKSCGAATDCVSGVCGSTFTCAAPTCVDAVQNGAETDVDCGGAACSACVTGKTCGADADCLSGACRGNVCADRLLISEIQTRGTNGGNDEFVEIYNPTSVSVVFDNTWTLQARSTAGGCASAYSLRATGTGAVIPAHRHLLMASPQFDAGIGSDVPLVTGVTDASSVILVHSGTVVDAVCFYYDAVTLDGYASCVPAFSCEGTPMDNLPHNNTVAGNVDSSIERKPGAAGGNAQDTDDNASDFVKASFANPQRLSAPPTP